MKGPHDFTQDFRCSRCQVAMNCIEEMTRKGDFSKVQCRLFSMKEKSE